MKYQLGDSFLADYFRLTERERQLFKEAIHKLNEAFANRTGWPPVWPSSLRVKALAGHPNLWELTWSFAGPDGRATFEFIDVDGEPGIKWRRVGRHDIFRQP